ncbi:MAG TPA: PA2779 family protein [Desulfuromonadales bacterium]|nr:PA2779 family protein [Desulfuromonadales bacterium]
MLKKIIRPVSLMVAVSFLFLDFSMSAAQAGMIDTQSVIAVQQQEANRQQVEVFLDRQDVRQALVRYGVDADEARARVASLSDAEVDRLAGQIDQLPAGGSAVGSIVGAAVFIFVVLLITDLLGLTHVFPFVYHRR